MNELFNDVSATERHIQSAVAAVTALTVNSVELDEFLNIDSSLDSLSLTPQATLTTDSLTSREKTLQNMSENEHLHSHKRQKREISSHREKREKRKTDDEYLAESIHSLASAFNTSITAHQEEGKTDFKRSIETLIAEFSDCEPLFIYRASQALEKENNATTFNSLKSAENKCIILKTMMTSIASIDL